MSQMQKQKHKKSEDKSVSPKTVALASYATGGLST